jgi:hypothetical protein
MVRWSLAVVLLLTSLGSSGCRRPPKVNQYDQEALEHLVSSFPAIAKMDTNGYVNDLKLEGGQVTDEALDHVARLIDLKSLSLFGSAISDQGLEKLQPLEKLEALGLGGTRITDRGLVVLHKVPTLRWVWLPQKTVTPQAVNELKQAIPGLTVHYQ